MKINQVGSRSCYPLHKFKVNEYATLCPQLDIEKNNHEIFF